jgi:hypothetical protein
MSPCQNRTANNDGSRDANAIDHYLKMREPDGRLGDIVRRLKLDIPAPPPRIVNGPRMRAPRWRQD